MVQPRQPGNGGTGLPTWQKVALCVAAALAAAAVVMVLIGLFTVIANLLALLVWITSLASVGGA